MGATMMGERVKDVLDAGSHGSTFGGNPVCAAGALHVLSRIDEALMQEVREKSAYIREQLQDAPGVKSVSGRGLMLGIETERPAGEVLQHCLQNGCGGAHRQNKGAPVAGAEHPVGCIEKGGAGVERGVCTIEQRKRNRLYLGNVP